MRKTLKWQALSISNAKFGNKGGLRQLLSFWQRSEVKGIGVLEDVALTKRTFQNVNP